MDGKLIDSVLVLSSVVQSDPALPKVGFQGRIQFDDFVEIGQRLVDFSASEKERASDQVELRLLWGFFDSAVDFLKSFVRIPLSQCLFDSIAPASGVSRVGFLAPQHRQRWADGYQKEQQHFEVRHHGSRGDRKGVLDKRLPLTRYSRRFGDNCTAYVGFRD